MSVGQYCNRQPITAERSTEIGEIARIMRREHVGTIVVVERRDNAEYPVGIVTDRDLVIEVLALSLAPDTITVGDIMSGDLVTAREDDNFWHTLDRMSAKGVRRLPVVNERGGLVGILTADDVLTALAVGLSDMTRLVQRELTNEAQKRR
ncbi:MAG: CBS domain-containing protein [Candidatus Competibacteraceae bacterium]